jgi:hypothetical protein
MPNDITLSGLMNGLFVHPGWLRNPRLNDKIPLGWKRRIVRDPLENPRAGICRLVFQSAVSAGKKDDQAYQQNQTKSAAADDGTAKVKPAAAEQEKQNN